jgi:EAL domain-containing protein (putative c-di-GMP-specific phosphodiesterase class I)
VPNMSCRRGKDDFLYGSTHECSHRLGISEPGFFRTYIQPIFSLQDFSTFGYEILNRPNQIPAEQFYDEILECGCFDIIDIHLVKRSLAVASQLPMPTFINVFPPTLFNLQTSQLAGTEVVFELNERMYMDDASEMLTAMIDNPFTIAIDDVCQGFSGLRAIIELNPSYIKLDKWLISGIESSSRKQNMVKLLVEYAAKAGQSKIIAEGVERDLELDVVRSLGVDYAQGYLLSRPQLYK